MDKKPSYLWALVVGLAFPVLQVLLFLFRFGNLDMSTNVMDYIVFFIGGLFIGLALVYFLGRSKSKSARRGTWIGFFIGLPFAAFGMMLGGLVGPLGSILFSISPGIFLTAIGYFIGHMFARE
jgi:hypothetical protein